MRSIFRRRDLLFISDLDAAADGDEQEEVQRLCAEEQAKGQRLRHLVGVVIGDGGIYLEGDAYFVEMPDAEEARRERRRRGRCRAWGRLRRRS